MFVIIKKGFIVDSFAATLDDDPLHASLLPEASSLNKL